MYHALIRCCGYSCIHIPKSYHCFEIIVPIDCIPLRLRPVYDFGYFSRTSCAYSQMYFVNSSCYYFCSTLTIAQIPSQKICSCFDYTSSYLNFRCLSRQIGVRPQRSFSGWRTCSSVFISCYDGRAEKQLPGWYEITI